MKRSRLFSALAVVATVLTCSLVGQEAETPDLVTNGTVRVESTKGVPLPNVHVHHEEGKLVVWGMLTTSSLPQHVDVTVVTSDREALAETQVIPTLVRRGRPTGLLWNFEAELLVSPPSRSIVKIGYGFGPHSIVQARNPSTTVQK
jgi:hypothetical protein